MLQQNHSLLAARQEDNNDGGCDNCHSCHRHRVRRFKRQVLKTMGPSSAGQMGLGMMMSAAAPNVTGSVNLSSTIGNALSSQIKVGLSQAADAAEKAMGNNSHAISAHLGQANGYLVYTVWLVDSSFKFHRAIVDVGNGKILSTQRLPMRPGMMMGGVGSDMMGPIMMNPGMMGNRMMGDCIGRIRQDLTLPSNNASRQALLVTPFSTGGTWYWLLIAVSCGTCVCRARVNGRAVPGRKFECFAGPGLLDEI